MERDTAEIIVKVYAVLAWLGALVGLLGALFFFGIGSFGGMGAMMGDASAIGGGFLAGLGIIFAIIMLAIAVFEAFVGYGLWTKTSWARVAAIVLSVLSLFSFPIGTIIGAIGIWLFGFEETVKSLFSAPAPVVAKKKQ